MHSPPDASPQSRRDWQPAGLPQGEMRATLARGIMANRHWISAMTGLTILFGVVAILLAPLSADVDGLDAALTTCISLFSAGAWIRLRRSGPHQVYVLLRLWVLVTALILSGLVSNALFGSHAYRFADAVLPYVAPVLPVVGLQAHTFLLRQEAQRIVLAFSLFNTLQIFIFTLRHTDPVSLSTASMFMICAGLAPLHAALMAGLNIRNRANLIRSLAMRTHELEQKAQRLEGARGRDEVSGGLDKTGVLKQLSRDLEARPDLSFSLIQMQGHDALVAHQTRVQFRHTVRQIAAELAQALGPQTRMGRINNTQFAVWAPDLHADAHERAIRSAIAHLQQLRIEGRTRRFARGSAEPGVSAGDLGFAAAALVAEADGSLWLDMSRLPEPA